MTWKPITQIELTKELAKFHSDLNDELFHFWNLVKITPEKWQEREFGMKGNGFWVVAIAGRKIIWYNDIDEGFNIGHYTKYGTINSYQCEQDEIDIAIRKLFENS